MAKQERDRRFAVKLRRLLPVLFDLGHVDVGNEIVGVGALEHEHLEGVVGLGSLNERDQIADQLGPQKIHGRGRNFHEQNGPFPAHLERLENHRAVVGCRAGGCLRDDEAVSVGNSHGLAPGSGRENEKADCKRDCRHRKCSELVA